MIANFIKKIFNIFKSDLSEKSSNCELYIGNLEYNTKPYELRKLFEQYGQVENLKIIRDPRTKKSKGYGFVKFYNAKAANTAYKYTNSKNFRGRELKIAFAKEKNY